MKKRHPRFCTYSTYIPNSDYDVTEYGLHLNGSSCKFGCRINAKRTDKLNWTIYLLFSFASSKQVKAFTILIHIDVKKKIKRTKQVA